MLKKPGSGFGRFRVGLYADEQTLTAAVVRSGIRGAKVDRVVVVPLIHSAPDSLAKAKSLLKEAGIPLGKAGLSLRGPETFLRYFEMPLLPKAEWKSAVRFEARKYAPFPIDEIECGFHVRADAAEKKLKVAFAGTRKESLDSALYALKPLGFDIVRVEPLAFSIVRAFGKHRAAGEECEILIRATASGQLSLMIVKAGTPLFARHSQIDAAAASDLAAMHPDIRLSLDYFSKYFKSEHIARITLCGAEHSDWAEPLSQEFGLPVEVSPFAAGSAGSGGDHAPAAAGAALRVMDWLGDEMNLISPGVEVGPSGPVLSAPEEQALLQRGIFAGAGIGVILAVLMFFLASSRLGGLRSEVARLTLGQPPTTAEELTLAEADAMQKNAYLRQLTEDPPYLTDKLSEISKSLPEGAWLTAIEYLHDDNAENPQRTLLVDGVMLPRAVPDPVQAANSFISALAGKENFMRGFDEINLAYIRNEPLGSENVARFQATARTKPRGETGA